VTEVTSHTGWPNGNYTYPGIIITDRGNAYISDNTISGCTTAITFQGISATIERNLIANCKLGIDINSNVQVQNNTIEKNDVGIIIHSPHSIVIYNNLQNNGLNLNFEDTSSNVNATLNWWGTTDVQAINQSIHDSKNDFNLGTINFVPFLSVLNSQAMPDPDAPIPTTNQSPTPSVQEFPLIIIVTIVLTAVTIAISAFKKKKVKNEMLS